MLYIKIILCQFYNMDAHGHVLMYVHTPNNKIENEVKLVIIKANICDVTIID